MKTILQGYQPLQYRSPGAIMIDRRWSKINNVETKTWLNHLGCHNEIHSSVQPSHRIKGTHLIKYATLILLERSIISLFHWLPSMTIKKEEDAAWRYVRTSFRELTKAPLINCQQSERDRGSRSTMTRHQDRGKDPEDRDKWSVARRTGFETIKVTKMVGIEFVSIIEASARRNNYWKS